MADDITGPVPWYVQMQMQGAIQQERGFARGWSAGASPAVQAEYIKSGTMKGAMAAENIRNRYFQSEWDQIRSTVIKPYEERLKAAQERYNRSMEMRVMPVPHTINAAQGRALKAIDELPSPGQPVPKDANGKPLPAPAAQNVAVQPGLVGAQEIEDALSFFDPDIGRPVKVASKEGVAWWQKADREFWSEYTSVNKEMMDALARYKGNPFVNQAMSNLINHTTNLAGRTATGQTDPMAQMKWMQEYQDAEAQRELQGAQTRDILGGLEKTQLRSQAEFRAALSDAMALSPEERVSRYGPKAASMMTAGAKEDAYSPQMQKQIAASYALQQEERLKEIERRQKSSDFYFTDAELMNPHSWPEEMAKDQSYGRIYTRVLDDLSAERLREVMDMPGERLAQIIKDRGGDATLQGMAAQKIFNTDIERLLQDYISDSPEMRRQANAVAYTKTLYNLEQRDNERVKPVFDQVVEAQINAARQYSIEHNLPWSEEKAQDMRDDRYGTIYTYTTGTQIPEGVPKDPATLTAERRTAGRRERQSQLLADEAWRAERARAAQAARVEEERARTEQTGYLTGRRGLATPALRRLEALTPEIPSARVPTAQPQPATRTPEPVRPAPQSSSWYEPPRTGGKRPGEFSNIGNSRLQDLGVQRAFARMRRGVKLTPEEYKALTGKELRPDGKPADLEPAVIESGNPYLYMEVDNLKDLLASTPFESPTYSLLMEALRLKGE